MSLARVSRALESGVWLVWAFKGSLIEFVGLSEDIKGGLQRELM